MKVVLVSFFFISGCATYSLIRPATTLKKGKVEGAAGLAVGFIAANPVINARVGIVDDVEFTGHYEVHSALAGLRVGLLQPKGTGVAIALGAEAGLLGIPLGELSADKEDNDSRYRISGGDYTPYGAFGPNLTLGVHFEKTADLYVGGKVLYAPAVPANARLWGIFSTNEDYYLMITGKVGGRVYIEKLFLGAETGMSVTPLWASPEIAGYAGVVF